MQYSTRFDRISLAGYGSVWSERTAGGREAAGSNPVTPTFKRHNFYNWKLCLFSFAASKWHQKKENTLGIRLYKFSFFRVRYMGRMKSMYGNGYGLDTYISNERKEYST